MNRQVQGPGTARHRWVTPIRVLLRLDFCHHWSGRYDVDKRAIRKSMRAARRAVSKEDRRRASQNLTRLAAASGIVRGARHIALYTSNDGEIDVSEFADLLRCRGATCYVPVIVGQRGYRKLQFAPVDKHTPVKPNRYGIPEPAIPVRRFLSSQQLDLMFVPLVAYDNSGNRLGMGGGYYDRTLAWRRRRRVWNDTRLVGVAYDFQRVDKLLAESWDIPLDGILTDVEYLSLL